VSDPRVLVVEHEAMAPAAWLGEWLEECGLELVVSRPYAGEALPRDVTGHRGLLVLGGSMDSWDDAASPWLPRTRDLVRDAEARGVPVLGICLGHQIAAAALGGEAGRNPAGGTVAVLPVCWGPEAERDPLFGPVRSASRAVHWNNDVVLRLPEGARVVARSPDGAIQAARFGRHTWGVQCHPEVSPAVVEEWVAADGAKFEEAGFDMAAFLDAVHQHADALARDWFPLARSFADLVRVRTGGAR
jgi:GMP synthase (glutamine-hydrolysing)